MEKIIKEIYNACAKSFLQYSVDYNMSDYNNRLSEMVNKYNRKPGAEFFQDISYAFAKVVNRMHQDKLGRG